MQKLLESIRLEFPDLKFRAGQAFYWAPETGEVFYKSAMAQDDSNDKYRWALLHEVSHALLHHKQYNTDLELLQLEVAAWARAEQLAKQYDLCIDANHIQDCLDTYRDWLHSRSICPSCTTRCLQQSDQRHYRCHNCHTTWRVSASRFCRPYRAVRNIPQPATIFAAQL
jgi:hypothetical protein